jgi:polysaccharide export outer membrane protein
MALPLCLSVIWADGDTAEKDKSSFASRDQRYKIQPNDVVEVQFRFTPEYNLTATVQPDGFITVPIAGDFHIGGMTLQEASVALAKQAGTRLRDPEVTILLKDFVKPHFIVAGEVNRPGTYDLRGQMTVVQGIAMSGGFKETARQTKVVLLRRVNPEYAEVKVLDIKKLMSPDKIREDIALRPDDVLVVPQNKISKLEPFMRIGSMGLTGLALGLR